MPVFKVKVKWGKQVFTDVEVDTDEEPMLFKAQLMTLTGVQPERQKVMVKGKTVKDETWDGVKLNNGATILMMGSAEELPPEPAEKVLFSEDMSERELAVALNLPPGLANLGNTCYLNATVQCLKAVPELRDVLRRSAGEIIPEGEVTPSQSVTLALRDLYTTMDGSYLTVSPILLLHVLHTVFPRFAEKSEHGNFVQQDANECWTELMRMLQQKLPAVPSPQPGGEAVAPKFTSFIDQYFGGTLDSTYKCTESDAEPETHLKENFLQLSCFISADVRYMLTGLKQRMKENITKYSSTLGRDAQYQKSSKINRLPAYLTIQFVRFFYKEKEAINAKILKDVKFSLSLDVFELCSDELQQKLMPMRAKFKEMEDKKVEEAQKAAVVPQEPPPEAKKNMQALPYYFEDDPGSNNSGYYELLAVLTHKGRSSSSGHYVAWVKKEQDVWHKCDDDDISVVTSEDILKLSGGGDWHCAYLLLYGPRVLEVPKEDAASS